MTTPNEDLILKLRGQAYTTCRPDQLCDQAADLLQSQAERIAELDSLAANAIVAAADSQKAYMKLLDENFALRAELADMAVNTATYEHLVDLANDTATRLLKERDTLRAELAAIAATEPSMIYHGRCIIDCGDSGHQDVTMLKMIARETKLFTRPMPAQGVAASMSNLPEPVAWLANYGGNVYTEAQLKQAVRDALDAQGVTELVDALEMIVSTHQGHCEHHVGVSKHSYNLANIAEEALSKYKGVK